MVDFSVKVEGLDKIATASAAIQEAVAAQVKAGLYVCGKQIESDWKKSILAGGKTGRIYKRRGVTHQASAPGEAPASDTGRYVNSINTQAGNDPMAVEVHGGGGIVNYAKALEFGTAKMEARPAAVPAVEMNKQFTNDRLAQAVRDGIAKGGT